MANHHGSEGAVYVGANAVAELNDWSVTERADFAEDSNLSDTARTYNAQAITSWQGEMTCFWDETDTNGQEALSIGASVTLNLYPEGNSTGDAYYTGTVLITEVGVAVQRGAVTERRFQFIGSGALSGATVS